MQSRLPSANYLHVPGCCMPQQPHRHSRLDEHPTNDNHLYKVNLELYSNVNAIDLSSALSSSPYPQLLHSSICPSPSRLLRVRSRFKYPLCLGGGSTAISSGAILAHNFMLIMGKVSECEDDARGQLRQRQRHWAKPVANKSASNIVNKTEGIAKRRYNGWRRRSELVVNQKYTCRGRQGKPKAWSRGRECPLPSSKTSCRPSNNCAATGFQLPLPGGTVLYISGTANHDECSGSGRSQPNQP